MHLSEIVSKARNYQPEVTEFQVIRTLEALGKKPEDVPENMIKAIAERAVSGLTTSKPSTSIASTTAQPKANLDRATRPAQKPIPKTDRVISQPTTKLAQVARNLDQDFQDQRLSIRGAVYDIATTRADELADALGEAPNIYNNRLSQRLEEGVYDRDSFRQGADDLISAFRSGFTGGGVVESGSEPAA